MNEWRVVALLGLAMAAAAVPLGCQSRQETSAKLKQSLSEALNHPQEVQVKISGGGFLSTSVDRVDVRVAGFKTDCLPMTGLCPRKVSGPKGKIRQVNLVAEHFELASVPVDRMEINFRQVRYGLWKALFGGDIQVASFRDGTCSFTFGEQSLAQFLRSKFSAVDGLKLALTDGRITAQGRVKSLSVVPISLSGKLQAGKNGEIYLADPQLQVSGLPMPGAICQSMLGKYNPLIDLNRQVKLPFLLKIRSLEVEDHRLRLKADLSARLTQQESNGEGV